MPPEDLQALVNQGVDPENIISISDEVDADADAEVEADENIESDVTVTVTSVNKPFTSPDESTTAKLLAVNSAAKNVKRKYAMVDIDTAATSNAIASNVTPSNSKAVPTIATHQATTANSSCGGYSTKLFYGNHQRSGVIVSPVSMKLTVTNNNDNGNGLPTPEHQLQMQMQSNTGEASIPTQLGATDSISIVEQVESKKARRVQKANRCVNSHGKRSK